MWSEHADQHTPTIRVAGDETPVQEPKWAGQVECEGSGGRSAAFRQEGAQHSNVFA